MQQEFGEHRVFSAPIAEDYIVGTANGMSRFNEKIRIVIEGAEFADYFWPAMEQYVDSSHDYWRSKGQFVPNMTIRLASGGYTTITGVRIVYPTFADDAAGLLRTAIRSKGITVFMEPKALYNSPLAAASIPDDFEVPFGKARIRREGNQLTVLTYGNTTIHCIDAANELANEGYDLEVIDLSSLIPLDKETILNSVKKTNKVLIVHEDKVFSGFGAELAAIIADEAFEHLDGPVRRVGSPFNPVGFNRILEKAILPNKERIIDAARKMIAY
jgi:2-oxoisovalerate dehydrogenase E1 component